MKSDQAGAMWRNIAHEYVQNCTQLAFLPSSHWSVESEASAIIESPGYQNELISVGIYQCFVTFRTVDTLVLILTNSTFISPRDRRSVGMQLSWHPSRLRLGHLSRRNSG